MTLTSSTTIVGAANGLAPSSGSASAAGDAKAANPTAVTTANRIRMCGLPNRLFIKIDASKAGGAQAVLVGEPPFVPRSSGNAGLKIAILDC
jgi:hypothetical protein